MRVLAPYTYDEPAHVAALERFAPQAERVDVLGDGFCYAALLAQAWAAGEDLVVIEHDIVIHRSVLPGFEKCPKRWCAFPYSLRAGGPVGVKSLGCVRFRGELLRDTQGVVQQWPWRQLDNQLLSALRRLGERPHTHYPAVDHLHQP